MQANLTKLFFMAICLSFVSPAKAQNVKPVYKKLIYVVYRLVGSGDKQTIRMEDYLEFDENGNLHHVLNEFTSDPYTNLTYEGSMTDTTIRVPDNLIADLNKIFNGSKPLKEYMITDKMPKGAQFAGPYEFITYSADHKTDNFVVVSGFLDKELHNVLDEIWHLPFGRSIQRGIVYRNKKMEVLVLKYHQACTYAPEIVAPPKVSFLMKAP